MSRSGITGHLHEFHSVVNAEIGLLELISHLYGSNERFGGIDNIVSIQDTVLHLALDQLLHSFARITHYFLYILSQYERLDFPSMINFLPNEKIKKPMENRIQDTSKVAKSKMRKTSTSGITGHLRD